MTILRVLAKDSELSRDDAWVHTRKTVWHVWSDTPWEDEWNVIRAVVSGSAREQDWVDDPSNAPYIWARVADEDDNEDPGTIVEIVDYTQELTEYRVKRMFPLGQEQGNRHHWRVELTYHDFRYRQDNPAGYINNYDKAGNPTDEPVLWWGSYFQTEEQIGTTNDQISMANSAEQMVEPAVVPRSYDTINFRVYTQSIAVDNRRLAIGAVNNNSQWGFSARQLKLASWKIKPVRYLNKDDGVPMTCIQNDIEVWLRTKLHGQSTTTNSASPLAWDYVVPDVSTVKKDGSSTTDPRDRWSTIDIDDSTSSPIPGINVMLDGAGAPGLTNPAVQEHRSFRVHREINFNGSPYNKYIPASLPTYLTTTPNDTIP